MNLNPYKLNSSFVLDQVDVWHSSFDPELVNAMLLYNIAKVILDLLLASQLQIILDPTFICLLNDFGSSIICLESPVQIMLCMQRLFLAGIVLTNPSVFRDRIID